MVDAAQVLINTRELLRASRSIVWSKGSFSGILIKSDANMKALNFLEDDGQTQIEYSTLDGSAVSMTTVSSSVGEGDAFRIEVSPARTEFVFVSQDLDDLLENFNFSMVEPKLYLLYEPDYSSIDELGVLPDLVKSYKKVLAFVVLLRRLSEYMHSGENRLIFFGLKRRFDLIVRYNAADLAAHSEYYDKFCDLFSENLHFEVKKTLFVTALIEITRNEGDYQRFGTLLSKISLVWRKFYADYQLYISEFSFESEKEKLEEKKRDYILGINNVLSSIQTQILAVPLSLVLVGGQMKLIGSNVRESLRFTLLFSNLAILAGAIFFTILMLVLTKNQFRALRAIKDEYNGRRAKYERDLPLLFQDLQVAFEEVDKRESEVSRLLIFVNVIVLLGFLFSCFMFVMSIPSARAGLAIAVRNVGAMLVEAMHSYWTLFI